MPSSILVTGPNKARPTMKRGPLRSMADDEAYRRTRRLPTPTPYPTRASLYDHPFDGRRAPPPSFGPPPPAGYYPTPDYPRRAPSPTPHTPRRHSTSASAAAPFTPTHPAPSSSFPRTPPTCMRCLRDPLWCFSSRTCYRCHDIRACPAHAMPFAAARAPSTDTRPRPTSAAGSSAATEADLIARGYEVPPAVTAPVPGSRPSSSSSLISLHTRNRTRNSCLQCHQRKIRCSRTIPCDNCISRGDSLDCNWEGATPVSAHPNPLYAREAVNDVSDRIDALEQQCYDLLK